MPLVWEKVAVNSGGKNLGAVKVPAFANTLEDIAELVGGKGEVLKLGIRQLRADRVNEARAKASGKTSTGKPKADLSAVKEIVI